MVLLLGMATAVMFWRIHVAALRSAASAPPAPRLVDRRRVAELEQELKTPLDEIVKIAEQVAVREMTSRDIPPDEPAQVESVTGNRYFTAPADSVFEPTCDDCDWIENRTLDGRVVMRYRVPCARHAADQIIP